jgi:hypothetical protein
MSGSRQRWQASLLALVMLGHVGCAARGGIPAPRDADRPRFELRTEGAVAVTSGGGPVHVKRAALVEAWKQETGQCVKDIWAPVVLATYGMGLIVLPAVCGVMTPILPPRESHRLWARDRHNIEATLVADNPSARLRDQVVAAAQDSGLRLLPLVATGPGVSDQPVDARLSWPPPEVTLEITVTDIGVRDDRTLARVSARIRALRTSDGSELATRTFVHQPPGREYWQSALGPALVELSKAITASLVWTPVPEVSPAPVSGDDPGSRTGAITDDVMDGER